jgi:4-diphosphocytidyl-2-C-methyl-D-erythritol kinase
VNTPLTTRARAKINLTLHVLGRRADGYHELESLVAFAGAGDTLTLHPGGRLELAVEGPTAALAGSAGDNLVLKAARELSARVHNLQTGTFSLVKRLPVAAGIGGGSSDAASALRLLAELNGIALDNPAVRAAAQATGADVPVCLDPRARMMRGAGESLGPAIRLPRVFAVLVNPGVPVATPDVFRALGLERGERRAGAAHPPVGGDQDREPLLALLGEARNDLEPAACAVASMIGEALKLLDALPGRRLARMSGSGATCFALFEDCRAATAGARAIKQTQPEWWVKATSLR